MSTCKNKAEYVDLLSRCIPKKGERREIRVTQIHFFLSVIILMLCNLPKGEIGMKGGG
jgi:hypothetical protein